MNGQPNAGEDGDSESHCAWAMLPLKKGLTGPSSYSCHEEPCEITSERGILSVVSRENRYAKRPHQPVRLLSFPPPEKTAFEFFGSLKRGGPKASRSRTMRLLQRIATNAEQCARPCACLWVLSGLKRG